MSIESPLFGSLEYLINIAHSKRKGYFTMPFHHYHDQYEIYYLLSGERSYFIEDRVYQVNKGSLVLIDTNVVHRTIDRGKPNHERLLINFKDEFLDVGSESEKEFLLQPFKNGYPVIELKPHEQVVVTNLLNKMVQEEQLKALGYETYLKSSLIELLVLVNRYLEQRKNPQVQTHSVGDQRISQIIQYINNHFSEPLNLTNIAEAFYISPYYLCRLFKKITGFNFVEYLNLVRIREAEKLLKTSDCKIIEIADMVGFESVVHFGRVFKSVTSLSPTAYRRTFCSQNS